LVVAQIRNGQVTKGLVALLKAVSGVTVWRLVAYIQVLTVTCQTATWHLDVDVDHCPRICPIRMNGADLIL
jgi:hypothetical protein